MFSLTRWVRFVCMGLLCAISSAYAVSLSGTVFASSTPMSGASVRLLASSGAVAATATVASDGSYRLSASSGTYDLEITPPSGTLFSTYKDTGLSLTTDLVKNVVLINASVYKLSGTVSFPSAIPRPASVTMGVGAQVEDTRSNNVTVPSTGAYSLNVTPDTKYLGVFASYATDAATGSNSLMYRTQLSVSGDAQKNISLSVIKITGRATNSSGLGVAGVQVNFLKNGNPGALIETYASYTAISGSDGSYTAYVLPGDMTVTLTPPSDAAAYASNTQAFYATADTVQDFALSNASRLTGTVTFPAGINRPSTVTLGVGSKVEDTRSNNVTVSTDGSYSIAVKPDTQYVGVFASFANDSATLSNSLMYRAQVSVSGDTQKNFTIPLVKVTGQVTDGNGSGVAGVQLSFLKNGNPGAAVETYASYTAVSDASGQYVAYVVPGDVGVTLTPASSSAFAGSSDTFNLTANITKNFTLSRLSQLTGVVTFPTGLPRPASVTVGVGAQVEETRSNNVTVGADGSYAIALKTDNQYVGVFAAFANDTATLSNSLMYRAQLAVSGSSSKNIAFPMIKVSGRVTDRNGVGIAGVQLSFLKNGNPGALIETYASSTVVSGVNGAYTTYLVPGDISVTVVPPTGSGFSGATLSAIPMLQTLVQDLVLVFKDTVAPIIVSGPLVKSITSSTAVVEWQTNEPTTGSVTTGNISATSPMLATTHSVQLKGLSASTPYNITVSATDASSNGPTTKTGSFTTVSSADSAAPVILMGPTVTARTEKGLVVEWITNEPAQGAVLYGAGNFDSTAAESTYSVVHRMALSGLTSNTSYQIKVTAKDVSGNGPTTSRTVTGLTLPSADTTPPVLTNGPLISNITDKSVMVNWITDKPSVSGVSWNDGTAYGVLTDPKLQTNHVQQVVGLSANTTYYLTVSSTDELGNGPTLSKTVSFKTLATASSKGPQVLLAPQISTITHNSAVVTWYTDQPSTSQVSYGTSQSSLSQTESQATLSVKHSVPLINLSPSTTYYLQVNSVNAAGVASINTFTNTQTNSTVIPFTTLANPSTQAPSFDTPPAVGYATDKQAVIGWTTDKVADTVVTLTNLTTNEPPKVAVNGSLDASHQLSVTGLTPGSTYRATVTSTDMAGNTSTQVLPDFSTPPQPDSSTPQITQGPGVVAGATTATITWATDKLSDSQVSYGTTNLSQMAGDISYTKQHKVVLGNLSNATQYQVKVVSTDPSGNSSTAATASFTTTNADGSGGVSVTTNSATTTTVGSVTSTTQSSSTGGTSTGSINNASLSSVTLVKGWNLIGNGADQTINVGSVFNDSTKFTTVWKWVASNTKWAFYAPSLSGSSLTSYAAGKSYDVLTTVNAGEGFWVNAAQATTINLQTGSTTPTGITSSSFQAGASKALPTGWSLIAVGDNKTPSEFNLALSTTPPTTSAAPLNLTTLWAWDAAVSNWMFYAPSLVNSGTLSSYISSKSYLSFGSKTLTPAMGFWVNKP